MNPSPFSIPKQLSPPVALALYELLQELTDALWQHYEIDLIEQIRNDHEPVPASQQRFDFDDEIPF
jgi:hypothetical protein